MKLSERALKDQLYEIADNEFAGEGQKSTTVRSFFGHQVYNTRDITLSVLY